MAANRITRMQPVQTVVDKTEQQRAEVLAASERRVAECEARLLELHKYEADYRRNYKHRASGGMSSTALRDYQTFLARLVEAIRQQCELVDAAKRERDLCRRQWQEAARRAKAVENVVEQWRTEERQVVDRREQRDSDERAQRKTAKAERTD